MSAPNRNVLITGGCGFVGSNLAAHLLKHTSARVRLYDNLSRSGVDHNLEWLKSLDGKQGRLEFIRGDVRDAEHIRKVAGAVSEIYHLAAQVAVTTSLLDPTEDCDINIRGTLNVLEAARKGGRKPFFLFTSTNKVYGALEILKLRAGASRYEIADPSSRGVDESAPLDFYSPYGCSKGAADQYVRDYARIYDIPAVVFRMSCIAGPRQFGNEDQGWVAHFLYSALSGQPITVYGDGKQVRDVLHVYDLIEAMEAARKHTPSTAGQIFNIGGGMQRAVSVLEVLKTIRSTMAKSLTWEHASGRPGDQPLYITDFRKLHAFTSWKPQHSFEQTLAHIHAFWKQNLCLDADMAKTHRNRGVLGPLPVIASEEVA